MKDKIEKYGSVIMLYNRMSLYRVLLILAGMGIVQTILFYRTVSKTKGEVFYGDMVAQSGIKNVCIVAFLMLIFVFCTMGLSSKGKSVYTFWRLRLSEWKLFWCRVVLNLFYCFLFWVCQVGLGYALGIYFNYQRGISSPQSILLAFYENGFLHRMFPMEDYVILLWDVVLILGVCISSGAFFFYRVRGKFHYPLVIAGLFLFLELSHIYSVLVATVLLGVMYYFTLRSIWIRGDMREI